MPLRQPRGWTLALSLGPWGGFYLHRHFCVRICLGWVALTFVPVEIDDLMEAYAAPKAVTYPARTGVALPDPDSLG